MKYRKTTLWFALALVACAAICSYAGRKDEITLVLVPREEATVQLGMDIANNYPTLLVSYKVGAGGVVSLHGWTGTQWVDITSGDYKAGTFFKTGPDSAVIVEKANMPVPEKLIPPADWCLGVSKITTTEMRPLLHLIGQYYDWSFKDWKWFAKRYNMDMDAINPEGLNVAWYNKRLDEHFKPRNPMGASDLQYWESVRQAAAVVEPVASETEAKPESAPAEMEGAEPVNLLTNDVPVAVVLGAGDVPEEVPAESGAKPAGEPAPETESPAEMQ